MRDFQRQRVYDWEDTFVAPNVPLRYAPIETLRIICGHMWSQMKFENPPRVDYNSRYKVKSTGGRYEILLSSTQRNEFTLVHEMAHSMNRKEDRKVYDGHGPNYVADYCALLIKFYGFDFNYLVGTLSKRGVKVNLALLIQHTQGK